MRPIGWLLALALCVAIPASDATLISQSGPRCYGCTAAASGEWADVYVATSGVGAELATANRVVGIDGTSSTDWNPNISVGNGCIITFESAGAYDGENSIKLVPPDTGVQPAYCGIIGGNLTNSGANDIAQVNIRWVAVLGSRYIDLASPSKWLCVGVSSTPGGARINRGCTFSVYEPNATYANGWIASITSDETQSWHEPEITDCYFWDCGTAAQKFLIVRTTADHSGSPAVAGAGEPLYFELEFDVRQDRGNANGRNRLYVRTRDGLINRTIDIPLTWEGTWSFTNDQIIEIEGLGWYWNTPGTANADNYIRYSHIAISANRAVNDPIGPPPGFDTSFLLLLVVQLGWLRILMKRLLAALLLIFSVVVHAAPTIDATGTAGAGCSGDATPTVAVTVSAGSDRYGIGWVYWEGAVTISAPTFAAQTPTLHRTHSTHGQFVMYIQDEPTTGAQTFGVTLSGAPTRCYIAWLTYSGVASVGTAVDDIVEAGTTVDVNVTSATNDLVVDAAAFAEATIVVGAGQTPRVEQDDFDSTFRSFGASDEAGAGTVTMSWTTGGATDGWIIAANLVAAGGSSSGLLRRRRGN